MKRQLGENLKNKHSDSSLLFRPSSRESQPRASETKGNIQHGAGSAQVGSPDSVRGRRGRQLAAKPGAGLGGQDSVSRCCHMGGGGVGGPIIQRRASAESRDCLINSPEQSE